MNIKILLVEDEVELQQNIKDILEIHDFEVLTADNGVTALELLDKEIFDIVISDIMMPELNGLELLARVRNDKKLINLPFLFLTAMVEKDDFRKGMEFGAEDYLTKPVHAKDLINAINIAIDKKKSRELWLSDSIEKVLNDERNVKYHELRTPLFGLMSILELVTTSIDTFDYGQLKEILVTAYDASKRLNESLLNLARFNDLKTYEPKKSDVISIKAILEESLENHKNEYVFISNHDFSCQFDINTLGFIFNEILTNASKFNSKEQIFLSLKEKTLIIANQQKIIHHPCNLDISPFSQIDRKYNEQQGLGLGLYLSMIYANRNDASFSAHISDDLKFIITITFK
ncbi:response regulator [Belliella sp. R4-6]|uniref:histidine kinase n=1 Tax=Belliella alkalica TaxID=1730871 RepID=A0ABS9V6J6_9BACT|nr:response regulator [Belliella alkalica]MCH7412034.1 response regulator [Belliella alkalica]